MEVAHDNVNQKEELETYYNQKISRQQIEAELSQIMGELIAETPSTTQQVDEVYNHRGDNTWRRMSDCNCSTY